MSPDSTPFLIHFLQRPPYHPTYASNPHWRPCPHPNHLRNSDPVTFFSKADWAQSTGSGFGWGGGLGGWVVHQPNHPPPPSQERLPPLGCEGGWSALPGKGGGMVGSRDDFQLSSVQGFRPGVALGGHCYLHPSPQTPPPIPHHPAPDSSGNQVQDHGGGERVWAPTIAVGWIGADLVPLASTPRAGKSRAGGGLWGGSNPEPRIGA